MLNEKEGYAQHKGPNYWIDEYLMALSEKGWKYITSPNEGKVFPSLVAAQDAQTQPLFNKWQETQDKVEIAMVLVMPNGNLGDLPARALGYLATTLNLATALRERTNLAVASLRILSPCYWNVYTDGGDITKQVANANQMIDLAKAYQQNYHPQLNGIEFGIDTGKPITSEMEAAMRPKVLSIQIDHPDIAADLTRVAKRHDINGVAGHLLDGSLRPLAYLLAHPPAWGYSTEDKMFAPTTGPRINFVPASELRYLAYMVTTLGTDWVHSPDMQIASLVSAKQIRAPYYPFRLAEIGKEITISDLSKAGAVLSYKGQLRNQTGQIEVAETMTGLNQLQTDFENANRMTVGGLRYKPDPLDKIIKGILK